MPTLIEIFGWFETGDIPTQDQFRATFASFRHKENKIPFNEVEGLATAFENTVTDSGFTAFKDDVNTKIIQLAKKDGSNLLPADVISWKDALGIASIAVVDSLDENGAVVEGNVYNKDQVLVMLDMLRQQVEGNNQIVEQIRETLVSNDLNLDELQEIVDYIKQNREAIEALQAVIIGSTTDDKITLTGNYSTWGAISLQNQFNDTVYNKIIHVEDQLNVGKIKHEEVIQVNTTIDHKLDTIDLLVVAIDMVTKYNVPVRYQIVDPDNLRVEFDDLPVNPLRITIRKL
ncbi:hypothetical protein [Chryseobacterium mulctrae]|uniref:hypothetical protein n=1 Tax=Chryseobacterium mulctrae TaxID=2576777 RepID=UPI001116BBCE|nr:hypothetical protein [Chryseobacterium mulctrae]